MQNAVLDDFNWPDGKSSAYIVQIERKLRRRLKRSGLGLLADRTAFIDPHYCGGYAICSEDCFLAGRNFNLTISEVEEWIETYCRGPDV